MDVRNSAILSFSTVKNKHIDRTYFFKNNSRRVYSYFSHALQELYSGVWSAFAFDQVNLNSFKNAMMPIVSAGAVMLVGNVATTKARAYYTENEEYDFVFKFLLASAVLAFSALHRITDKKMENTEMFSLAVGSEVMAIAFLYYSSFQGTQFLLKDTLPDNYALIAGLGTAGLVVPGTAAFAAKKIQNQLIKREYAKGAQRSDTALMIAGLTAVANAFFQMHYYLFSEMTLSRVFQLVLISDAILFDKKFLKQIRDVPALCADVGPPIIKNLMTQQARIEQDFKVNTQEYVVLRFTKKGSEFVKIQGQHLRTGDLVFCDETMDFSSMPISGEVIALEQNPETLEFYPKVLQKKISTNLQKHNGESNWIELPSNTSLTNQYKTVDLHAIHEGKQSAVLVGSKLNLNGEKNFFIQIKPAKERSINSSVEKKSVIADIITQHKQKSVIYSILLSIGTAALLSDIHEIPANTLRLLFHLFQMTIPFSETLLREMVARRLMKKINANLPQNPLEMKDAYLLVDLCNAISGYYADLFPQGVAIISDKTGTLTTSQMDVVGVWTSVMKPDVESTLQEDKQALLPGREAQLKCAKIFSWLFTNQKKEIEPEEFAIKQFLSAALGDPDFLTCDVLGNNHFRKKITIVGVLKQIETWHLGLYSKKLGGRFTLVQDGKKHYLVFCGVPNAETFKETPLLKAYVSMQTRQGVLSRDWCAAYTKISEDYFLQLKKEFEEDNKKSIEALILQENKVLHKLSHVCTFLVNNPLKKEAEKFIERFKQVDVPVFIATGDTAKAAKNIADILYRAHAGKSIVVRNDDIHEWLHKEFSRDTTLIFSGMSDSILTVFKRILVLEPKNRPVVIFSEMSTEGKGILAEFLKENGFFVGVNGDGTNDVEMMRKAHVVLAHLTDEGTYAPGVEQFANLNDGQLQKICHSDKSFYELFDLYHPESRFIKIFAELANSLEKASILLLKSSKMGFELFKSIGFQVKEMWQQHWFSALFDLGWLVIAFHEINESTDRPMDNKHLCASDFSMKLRLAAFAIALVQASTTYALTGESTNLYCMALMLACLPVVLKSLFSAFGHVQEEQFEKETPREKPLNAGIRFQFFNRRPHSDSVLYAKPTPAPLAMGMETHSPRK